MDSSLTRKAVKRLVEAEEASGILSLLPEQDTTIHYHLLHMQQKGLGVPQDNKYARALEALRGAEKRRKYSGLS